MLRASRAALAVFSTLTLTLSGCSGSVTFSPSSEPQAADADLGELRVAEEKDDGSYKREAFGTAWKDVDHNGCDTRNDILARDLTEVKRDADGCKVLSGELKDDPYTDGEVSFTRSKPTAIQIDHVYPLALAWRMGAEDWPKERREQFANDPANLLAVGGRENQRKGDSGPEEWKPPTDFQCAYGRKFVAVAGEYSLPVTSAAHDALAAMLKTC